MSDKKKVLIVIQQLRRGGIEIAAVNFASHLNSDKYEFTYYLQKIESEQDKELAAILEKSNSKIIIKPDSANNYIEKYRDIKRVLSETHYDIVHSHVMFYNGLIMLGAKQCGVPKRVSHSHGIKWNRAENLPFKIYRHFMRLLINSCATDKLACSTQAGEYMYGKKEYEKSGFFLANGVETDKFSANNDFRSEKRKEFGIKNKELLIGHIGTIYKIKNQTFLIEIFAEMLKTNPDSRLLLVGEEVERDKAEEKARHFNVLDKIIFAGCRNDIPQLLQAMDIMIFPSLFEGLPVSLIEAQASRLPCLISDRVTSEVKYNKNVDFLPLEKSPAEWAGRAFELLKIPREAVDISSLIKDYDINKVADKLDKIYNS